MRTSVVGIGTALEGESQIGPFGGGTETYLPERSDLADAFVDALKEIALSSRTCEFEILAPSPPGDQVIDLDKIDLWHVPEGSDVPTEIPMLDSGAGCEDSWAGGWFYDDPRHPTKIQLCPCSCILAQTGRIEVLYGCQAIDL